MSSPPPGLSRSPGLDKEIQELIEAVVLPMTHKHMFDNIGIRPPKGILLHGPPGTGKTLLARACAKQTDAIFLKLAGPQLVQVRGHGCKGIEGTHRCIYVDSGGRGRSPKRDSFLFLLLGSVVT